MLHQLHEFALGHKSHDNACVCQHICQLQVKGFNLRKWISGNSKQLPKMLDALGKLVRADKLKVAYTE